jgi:hypothetical protein
MVQYILIKGLLVANFRHMATKKLGLANPTKGIKFFFGHILRKNNKKLLDLDNVFH